MDRIHLEEIVEHGHDSGQGNLLGIQPYMNTKDYASEAAFSARLESYFQLAFEKEWLGARTIVVLPEYLGTWLVVAGEHPSARAAATVSRAMLPLILRHPVSFLAELLRGQKLPGEKDHITAALFRMKASSMTQIYQSVFSHLAKKYAVTLVAGSILLPEPQVQAGRITPGKGRLINTSFVFYPDGHVDPRDARKVYPIQDEQPFVAAAALEDLPVFDTPAGKLGVLVCADSWYPPAYQRLKSLGAALIAVPSVSTHGEAWEKPWNGYSGYPLPSDVAPEDVGRLTERQAWGKYALAGRINSCDASAGINVFLYGDLWDLEMNGGRWRMVQGADNIEGSCYGPALINLWLA